MEADGWGSGSLALELLAVTSEKFGSQHCTHAGKVDQAWDRIVSPTESLRAADGWVSYSVTESRECSLSRPSSVMLVVPERSRCMRLDGRYCRSLSLMSAQPDKVSQHKCLNLHSARIHHIITQVSVCTGAKGMPNRFKNWTDNRLPSERNPGTEHWEKYSWTRLGAA